MENFRNKVIEFVKENERNIVQDIKDICAIKSLLGPAEENAPFSADCFKKEVLYRFCHILPLLRNLDFSKSDISAEEHKEHYYAKRSDKYSNASNYYTEDKILSSSLFGCKMIVCFLRQRI